MQGVLERASPQNFILRWIKYVKNLALQFLCKRIELKYETRRTLEFKLIKMQMEKQKIEKKLSQLSTWDPAPRKSKDGPDAKKQESVLSSRPSSADSDARNKILQTFEAKEKQIGSVLDKIQNLNKQIQYMTSFLLYCDQEMKYYDHIYKLLQQAKASSNTPARGLPDQVGSSKGYQNIEAKDLLTVNVALLVMIYLRTEQVKNTHEKLTQYEKVIMDFMVNDPLKYMVKLKDLESHHEQTPSSDVLP